MEKNEKKKWYVQPETEVVDVEIQGNLLSGSCSEQCPDDGSQLTEEL